MALNSKDKYLEFARQHSGNTVTQPTQPTPQTQMANTVVANTKSKEDTEKEIKEAERQMQQNDLHIADLMRTQAKGWSDAERDEFKKKKAMQEGIDYMEDLKKLQEAISEDKPLILISCSTTGLMGKNTDKFFDDKYEKSLEKKADGNIDLRSKDNMYKYASDTLTQLSFVYYEKGVDGFYHESTNPELSLRIPLISVAPMVIQRALDRYQDAIDRHDDNPFNPFTEANIDVEDLKNKKGIQSDKLVQAINDYMAKPEVQNALLMDYTSPTKNGNKKDFITNFINHTYNFVGLVLGEEKRFPRDMDVNLYEAVTGYNLKGNRRLISGANSLKNTVETLKEFYGDDNVLPMKSVDEKIDGIAYVLNEFCLREMLEKNSPTTNLKFFDYCSLCQEAQGNSQKQTEENKNKLNDLRNEIVTDITKMKAEMEYARSLGDEEMMPNFDDGMGYDDDLDIGEPDFNNMDFEDLTDIEEPEFIYDEEANEEDDKAYEEVSKDEAIVVKEEPIKEESVDFAENFEENIETEKVVEETVEETVNEEPIVDVEEEQIESAEEEQIRKATISAPSNNEVPSINKPLDNDFDLRLKELQLRSLEADLKLKEIELAKRELELQSKTTDIARLTQNNNYVLMQSLVKTVGLYLGNDEKSKKLIMETLNNLKEAQKTFNSKMDELESPSINKE